MAKGKKTGGRDFDGSVPGPGRPALPESVKALRKLTPSKLEEIADLILDADRTKLSQIAASQTEPAIRVAYAKAALNAMTKGELSTIEMILARLIGKVPDRHAGPNGEPLGSVSDDQLDARIRALSEKAK